MKPIGLYVHLPFCSAKCPYCDFYSLTHPDIVDQQNTLPADLHQRYTDRLIDCIMTYQDRGRIADTLYFGGGTPSLLEPRLIAQIIQACRMVFQSPTEITIEANPSLLSEKQLFMLHDAGVNRISFGLQSAHQKELHTLGRQHTPSQAIQTVHMARAAGFKNISADVMLGIPHQTPESFRQTLAYLQELQLEHISAYVLKLELDTPFYMHQNRLPLPTEDSLCDDYLALCEILPTYGLLQYEISNFAKPGYQSQHNLKYWRREEYLGFGASAHSFFEGRRFFYPRDLQKFLTEGISCICLEEQVPHALQETLMLRLRLTEGVDLALLEQEFGSDVVSLLRTKIVPYQHKGVVNLKNSILSLTPSGFLISNAILADLTSL